ncbi:hypothetical protein MnTg02_00653 [bacterium MnTg02]|nr:hypothetical protein MnTg02_00653 [bacterium MnTg02]
MANEQKFGANLPLINAIPKFIRDTILDYKRDHVTAKGGSPSAGELPLFVAGRATRSTKSREFGI